MRSTLYSLCLKLLLLAALSTVPLFAGGGKASAHEVLPTIADITISPEGGVVLEMRANVEAFLAGIDLDTVEDTDADDAAGDYDALRALSATEITNRLPGLIANWNSAPLASAGDALVFELEHVDIANEEDFEIPRTSSLRLVAPLPQGATSVVLNWPKGAGSMVLRQQGVEDPFTGYVQGGESSPPIAIQGGGAQSGLAAFVSYIPVGFDHILPKGLDHILFVLGLFFLSTQLRPLVMQISAFTLAHTFTLALGALGLVNVPPEIVEPLIAASIVYVAVENVFTSGLNPWRPVVIFGFGLLHGLGFASVLGEFGLPEGQFIPALIGFNIGVEFGQLTVIAIAFLTVGWFGKKIWYRNRISVPASCAIAAVGAYWCVERVFF